MQFYSSSLEGRTFLWGGGGGSVNCIAICYGLDGSGLELRCGQENFSSPYPSRPALWGSIQAPTPWVPGVPSGGKTGGACL
jgi:hypothetical protein